MAAKQKKNEKRITLNQRTLMMDFMEKYSDFARRKLTGKDGQTLAQKLWEQLASLLNAEADGVTKTAIKWNKSWQDWKSSVKDKAAAIKADRSATAGGEGTAPPLTKLEERLHTFMGLQSSREGRPFSHGSAHKSVKDPLENVFDNTALQQTQISVPAPMNEPEVAWDGNEINVIYLDDSSRAMQEEVQLGGCLEPHSEIQSSAQQIVVSSPSLLNVPSILQSHTLPHHASVIVPRLASWQNNTAAVQPPVSQTVLNTEIYRQESQYSDQHSTSPLPQVPTFQGKRQQESISETRKKAKRRCETREEAETLITHSSRRTDTLEKIVLQLERSNDLREETNMMLAQLVHVAEKMLP